MSKNKVSVYGCNKYYIDSITHEVTNKKGARMRPFVDLRGNICYKLMCDKGQQTTRTLQSIRRNTLVTDVNTVEEVGILPEVLVSYYKVYENITPDMSVLDISKMVLKVSKVGTLSEVGAILQHIGL